VKAELHVVSISRSTPCLDNTVKYSTVTFVFVYIYIYIYKLEAFRQRMRIFPSFAHSLVGSSHQENGVLSLSDFDQSVLFSCGWFKVTAGRPLRFRNITISGIVNWVRFRRKRSCCDRLSRFYSGGTEKLQVNT